MRGKFALSAVVALALTAGASPVRADLVGATYDFSTSVTGNTQIGATSGTYTDPANPGFCVGPPVACGSGAGLSGSFTFADLTATTAQITFAFFGSTDGAGPGTFVIDLGNFLTTDGDKITNVTYGSGNLLEGDFSNVSWNGADAVFTGSAANDYDAIGGASVVFGVTMAAAVPEPATWALLGLGFAGLGFIGRRRANKTVRAI